MKLPSLSGVVTRRRSLLVVLVVVPLALVGVVVRAGSTAPTSATFAALAPPRPPYVPTQAQLSATWFCAGVPMPDRGVGDRGRGGVVSIVNPTDTPLQASLTAFTTEQGVAPIEQQVEVAAFSASQIDIATVQSQGSYVAAMVEIIGGGGFVEQRADHADGSSVSPCSNTTSDSWFLADNYTLNDSREDLVIVNPYPDTAIVNISFSTDESTRSPQDLQGMPVEGRSIKVVSEEFMPKDEAILAADIRASRGRIVVARAQRYQGERQGFSLALASPAAFPEWYFAEGERSDDVAFERYSIYNPGERDVTVDVTVLGVSLDDNPEFVPFRSDLVPAGKVISYTTKEFENLPDGRHFLSFSTESDSGIVVERGITRREGGNSYVTAVSMGAPQPFLGYTRWSMAFCATVATENVLVVANLDYADGTVTVKALGPGGEQPVPGLESVPLPASGVIAISIPAGVGALGVPIIVESSQRIVVERSIPRREDRLGRTSALALPG